MSTAQKLSLPVIVLAQLNGDSWHLKAFMKKLDNAACEVGFFYLTGHGISQRLLDDLQSVSRQFFALSEQEKLSVQMANSPHFRGYNRGVPKSAFLLSPLWSAAVDWAIWLFATAISVSTTP